MYILKPLLKVIQCERLNAGEQETHGFLDTIERWSGTLCLAQCT